MRFAIRHEQRALREQHAVRSRKFPRQRICLRAVTAHAGPQHRQDNSSLEVDAPDGVIFGIRQIKVVATTLVGSPETIVDGINRMLAYTDGGAGAILFRAHDWANREQTLRSYELFARWVMPRFQGSADSTWASREWCSENRQGIFGPAMGALKKAFVDAGQEVPDMMRMRLHTGKTEVG